MNLYFHFYFTCHSSDWSRKYVSEIASIFSTVPMSEIWKLFVIIVTNLIKGERPESRQSRLGGCTAGRWQGRRWWGRSSWSARSQSPASCPPGSESRWTFSRKKWGWSIGWLGLNGHEHDFRCRLSILLAISGPRSTKVLMLEICLMEIVHILEIFWCRW